MTERKSSRASSAHGIPGASAASTPAGAPKSSSRAASAVGTPPKLPSHFLPEIHQKDAYGAQYFSPLLAGQNQLSAFQKISSGNAADTSSSDVFAPAYDSDDTDDDIFQRSFSSANARMRPTSAGRNAAALLRSKTSLSSHKDTSFEYFKPSKRRLSANAVDQHHPHSAREHELTDAEPAAAAAANTRASVLDHGSTSGTNNSVARQIRSFSHGSMGISSITDMQNQGMREVFRVMDESSAAASSSRASSSNTKHRAALVKGLSKASVLSKVGAALQQATSAGANAASSEDQFTNSISEVMSMIDLIKGNRSGGVKIKKQNGELETPVESRQGTANQHTPGVRRSHPQHDKNVSSVSFDIDFGAEEKIEQRMTIKSIVDKSIKEIKENPENMQKLDQDIDQYIKAKKQAQKNIAVSARMENIVEKNKYIPSNLPEVRLAQIQQNGEELQMRIHEVRQRRVDTIEAELKRKEEIAEREEQKMVRAEKKRQEAVAKTILAERKMKWSYLILVVNRYKMLAEQLSVQRAIRFEKEKQRKMHSIVYTKIMPLLWRRRSLKWREAWDTFQKHWVFYRLYIDIKKKKEAITMVRKFLKEATAAMQFVRQTRLFRHRVMAVQMKRRDANERNDARLMTNLLRYCIVEAKLLRGEPLKDSAATRISSPVFNESTREYEYPTFGNKGFFDESTPNSQRSGPKAAALVDLDTTVLDEDDLPAWHNRSSLFIYHAPYEFKKLILLSSIEKRTSDYYSNKASYERDLREFLAKAQKMEYHHKAANLLGNENKTDLAELIGRDEKGQFTFYVDEQGEKTNRPSLPCLRLYLSEKEMEPLVLEGFKMLQKLETRVIDDITLKFGRDEKEMEQEKARYLADFNARVDQSYQNLQDYFPRTYARYVKDIRVRRDQVNIVMEERRKLQEAAKAAAGTKNKQKKGKGSKPGGRKG